MIEYDSEHSLITLANDLGLSDIMIEAEKLYGDRNTDFTILGIEISNIVQPQTILDIETNNVTIQITERCQNNEGEAIFQAAHEVIHCLHPNHPDITPATYLEEGLATYFSVYYTQKIGNPYHTKDPDYCKAYNLAEKLLEIDGEIIKKARKDESNISKIDKNLLLKLIPTLDENFIDDLISIF